MLGPVLLFIGYSFIYASVAKGGRFATDPWNGVFSDAYVDTSGVDAFAAAGIPVTPGTPISSLTTAPPASFSPPSTKTFSRPRGNG